MSCKWWQDKLDPTEEELDLAETIASLDLDELGTPHVCEAMQYIRGYGSLGAALEDARNNPIIDADGVAHEDGLVDRITRIIQEQERRDRGPAETLEFDGYTIEDTGDCLFVYEGQRECKDPSPIRDIPYSPKPEPGFEPLGREAAFMQVGIMMHRRGAGFGRIDYDS